MSSISIKSNIIKKEVKNMEKVWGDVYYKSYKEVRFTDGLNNFRYVYADDALFILSGNVWILIS